MVGGLETLKQLTPEAYVALNSNAKNIIQLFTDWFATFENGRFKDLSIVNEGSLFWIHPGEAPKNASNMPAHLTERFYELFSVLLDKGIYLAPNAYEISFISLAHDKATQEELKERLYS